MLWKPWKFLVSVLDYLTDFLKNDCFPIKTWWKSIVRDAIVKEDQLSWMKKISRKSVLESYLAAHPSLQITKWYEIYMAILSDRFKMNNWCHRPSLGSLKIKNNRLGNPGTLLFARVWTELYTNPRHHVILFC